ncbi:unnamed protein product [Phytomonas sp. Hart1]|nr:unnamed protein product [Phytomonas sp. Hart1]|eukprot:CCW70656.1 unnamed protein product [Phytomonas sp. isolate Hart1]
MAREEVFFIVCALAGVSALVLFQHFNTIKREGKGKSPSRLLPVTSRPRQGTLSVAHSQSRARSQNVPNGSPRPLSHSHHRGRAHSRSQAPPTTGTNDSSLPGVAASLANRFELAVDGAGALRGGGGINGSRGNHLEVRTEPLTARALSQHSERNSAEGGRYANEDRLSKPSPFPTSDMALHGQAPRGTSANSHRQPHLFGRHLSRSTSVAATDGSKSIPAASQAVAPSEQDFEARSLSIQDNHLGRTGKGKGLSTSPYSRDVRSVSEASKSKSLHRQNPQPENLTVAVISTPSPVQPQTNTGDLTGECLSILKNTAQSTIHMGDVRNGESAACRADNAALSPVKPEGLMESAVFTPSPSRGLELSPIITRPDVDDCSPEGRVVAAMIEESVKVSSSPPHNKIESLESKTERLPYFLLMEMEEQVSVILQNLYYAPWKPRLWMLLYSYLKQLPRSAIMHLAQCETITSVLHRLEHVTTLQPLGGFVDKERAEGDIAFLSEVRQETCAILLVPTLGTLEPISDFHFEWKDKKIIRYRGNSLPKRPVVNHSINASSAHPSFHDSLLVFSESGTNEALSSMTTDADNVMTVLRHFRFLFTEAAETQVTSSHTGGKAAGVEKEFRDAACQAAPDATCLPTTDEATTSSMCDLRTPLRSISAESALKTSEAALRVLQTFTQLTSDDAFQKLHRDPQYAVMAHEFTDLALEVKRLLDCTNGLEVESLNTPEGVQLRPAASKKSINTVKEENKGTLVRPNHVENSRNWQNHLNSGVKQTQVDAKNRRESVQAQHHLQTQMNKVVGSPFKAAKPLTPKKPSLGVQRKGLISYTSSQLVSAGF